MSDTSILDNAKQLQASLALTVWLMARYHIALGDVIGHNESLTSPYHHELYAAWRCQTHGDWTRPDMDRYRSLLAALAMRDGVLLGRRVDRVASQCLASLSAPRGKGSQREASPPGKEDAAARGRPGDALRVVRLAAGLAVALLDVAQVRVLDALGLRIAELVARELVPLVPPVWARRLQRGCRFA